MSLTESQESLRKSHEDFMILPLKQRIETIKEIFESSSNYSSLEISGARSSLMASLSNILTQLQLIENIKLECELKLHQGQAMMEIHSHTNNNVGQSITLEQMAFASAILGMIV
jgi:hypothetical protein